MRSKLLVGALFSTLMACGVDVPAGRGNKLTSTEVEPPGAHCAAGGVAVHTGLDDNANGLLDDAERDATTYTCAHATLVREDTIGSGSVCPGGGVLVHSGHDLDDNNALEDQEIETTATVCHSDEIYRGELKTSDFATSASRERLSRVRVVTGNVFVDSDASMPSLELVGGNLELRTKEVVELPKLERIVGNLAQPRVGGDVKAPLLGSIGGDVRLTANGDATTTFSAPSLTAVDGHFLLAGTYTTLDLDKLATVGGDLDIDVQTEVQKLSLPSIKDVTGNVIVSGWFASMDMSALETAAGFDLVYSNLTELTLPSLKTASLIRVGQSAMLTRVEMPSVSGVQQLVLWGSGKLGLLDLPLVTELDKLSISGLANADMGMFANLRAVKALAIQNSPQLLDLGGLDQLTTMTTLTISNNAKLADLGGLDSLASVTGNVTITKNPALTNLSGLAALTNIGGQIVISDNTALPQAEIDAFLHRLGR